MATDVQSTIPVPTTANPSMPSTMPARHKSKSRVVTNKDRKRSDYYDDVFEPATPPPPSRQQHPRSGRQDNRSDRSSRNRPALVSDNVFEPPASNAPTPSSGGSSSTPQSRRASKGVRHASRSDSRGGPGGVHQGGYPHVTAMGWRAAAAAAGGHSDPRQGAGSSSGPPQMPRVPSSPRPPSGHPGQHSRASSRAPSRGGGSRPREQSVQEVAYPPSPLLQRPPHVPPGVHTQVQYTRQMSVSSRYSNGAMSSPAEAGAGPSTPTYVIYPSHSMPASCETGGSPLVAAASPQYPPCLQPPPPPHPAMGNQPPQPQQQAGVAPGNGYAQQQQQQVSYCCNCSMCVAGGQPQQPPQCQQQQQQQQQVYMYGQQQHQQMQGQMVANQPPSTPLYYQTGGPPPPPGVSYSTANPGQPPSVHQAAGGPVGSQQSSDGQYKTSAVYTVPVHAAPQCCTAENSGAHPNPTPTATPTPEVQQQQQQQHSQRSQDVQQRGGSELNSPVPPQSAGMYGYPPHPSAPRSGYPPEGAQVQSPTVFYYPNPQAEVPQHPYPAVQPVTTPTEATQRCYSSSEPSPMNLNLSGLPPGFYKIVQNGVVQSYVQVGGNPPAEQLPINGQPPQTGYYPSSVQMHPDDGAQRHGSVAQQGQMQSAGPQDQVQQQVQHGQGQQPPDHQQQQHPSQQQMYASPQTMDPRRGPPYQGDVSKQQQQQQQTPTYLQGPSPSPGPSPYASAAYQPPSSGGGGCSYADHPDPNIHLKPGLLPWNPQQVYDAPTRFVYPANPYHHGVPQMRLMAPYPMAGGCYPGNIRPMTAARAKEYGEYTYDSEGERDGNSSSSECSTCDSELEEGSVDEQTEALASLMDKYIESVQDEETPSKDGEKQEGNCSGSSGCASKIEIKAEVKTTAAKTETTAGPEKPGKTEKASQDSTESTAGKEAKEETPDTVTDEGNHADVESAAASSNEETRRASVSSSNANEEQASSDGSAQGKSKDIDIVAATAALKMLLNISDERKSAAASKMAMSISVKNSVSCYELESQMNSVSVESISTTNEIQVTSECEASGSRDDASPDCESACMDNPEASKARKGSDSNSHKSKSSLGAEDGDIESGDDDDASGWCTEEEVEEMDEENMLYEEEVFARYTTTTTTTTQKAETVRKEDKKKAKSKKTAESEKYDDVFEDENELDQTGGFDTASHSKNGGAAAAKKAAKRKSSSDDGKSSAEHGQGKDDDDDDDDKDGNKENTPTDEGAKEDNGNTSMELVPYSKSASRRHGKKHGGSKGSKTSSHSQVIYHVSPSGQIFPSRPGHDLHPGGGGGVGHQHGEIRFSAAGGNCMAATFPGGHGTLRYVVQQQSGGPGSGERAVLQPVYSNSLGGVHHHAEAGTATVGVNGFVQQQQHPASLKVQEFYSGSSEEALESSSYVPHGQLHYVCSGCQGNGCCEGGGSEGIGPIPVMTQGHPKGHQGYKYLIAGQSWGAPELVHQCPEGSTCNGDCDNWGSVVYVSSNSGGQLQGPGGSGCQGNSPQTPSRGGGVGGVDEDGSSSVRGYTPEREWFRSISEECGEDPELLVEPAAHAVGPGPFGDGVFPGRNFRWGNYPRPPLIHDYEVILPPAAAAAAAAQFPDKRRSSSRTSSTGSSGKDGPKRRKSRSKNARPDECNIS